MAGTLLARAELGGTALARKGAGKRTTAAPTVPSQYVDVFIGTGGHGHTYPGATLPFGMVQLGPDTYNAVWDSCSGYHASDSSIMGFSHTHLSGTGIGDMLDVLVMPRTGPVQLNPGSLEHPESGYRSRYQSQYAEPGYYRVLLSDTDITAELTASLRAGMHRYTFGSDAPGHVLIDFAHGMQDKPGVPTRVTDASLALVGNDTLVGGRRVHQWADGRYVYFAMKLSRPFAGATLYSDDAAVGGTRIEGAHLKAVLRYPDAHDQPLLIKVGLSAVDIDGALRNLEQEMPGWDFDGYRIRAAEAWNAELSRVHVETTNTAAKRIFYTSLYHSLLAPTLFDDVDGRYRGMDLDLHRLPEGSHNYSTYSLWDTYRALHPMLTLLQPDRVPDLVSGLIRMGEESPDGVPVWPLQGVETGCMTGYHSAVVVAEACVKGLGGPEIAKAWPLFRQRAMDDDYRGLAKYRTLGFIPSDQVDEAASKTLEYAYDDWAVAAIAAATGATSEAMALRRRSQNYRHLFDKATQFVRPRLANGEWAEPFDPRGMGHSSRWRDFTECNAWQATFLNQHDVTGYIRLFGGDEAFEARLDELFSTSSELPPDAPPDIAGLVGQYAHGNEPSHHIAYLYAYVGAHHKTQARVRRLLEGQYHAAPDGLAGNEDCGQMSAWYVMSALGIYAVDPVGGNYVFGSPLFDDVTIDTGSGHSLRIQALNNGPGKPYIQSITWQGRPWTRSWIPHGELARGGHLVFTMGARPNLDFGRSHDDRPRADIDTSLA